MSQLAVAAAVVVVDQLVKWWAVERLDDGEVIELFWTAQFRLVRNDGAAFGVGTSITPVITIAAITISVAVILYGRSVRRPWVAVALGAVLGGAVGNVIDRFLRPGDGFLRGAVIDYIDFQWWPVFNIADIAIVCGGFALVLLLRDEDLTRRPPCARGVRATRPRTSPARRRPRRRTGHRPADPTTPRGPDHDDDRRPS